MNKLGEDIDNGFYTDIEWQQEFKECLEIIKLVV